MIKPEWFTVCRNYVFKFINRIQSLSYKYWNIKYWTYVAFELLCEMSSACFNRERNSSVTLELVYGLSIYKIDAIILYIFSGPCNAGYYLTTDNGCSKCGSGTWSKAEATSCISCADGKMSSPGSTSESDCSGEGLYISRISRCIMIIHLDMRSMSTCSTYMCNHDITVPSGAISWIIFV